MHNRFIRAHSFERDDGLWEIEAELIDHKEYDFTRRSGAVHPAGQPFHHLHLRVAFDDDFIVQQAVAVYDTAPFGEECRAIEADYGDLVGMNLIGGFRQAVKARFARTAGCSHMSELAGVLPTVAMQTMANRRANRKALAQASTDQTAGSKAGTDLPERRPFQIEGCYALRINGPVVKEHHPQWYVAPQAVPKIKP